MENRMTWLYSAVIARRTRESLPKIICVCMKNVSSLPEVFWSNFPAWASDAYTKSANSHASKEMFNLAQYIRYTWRIFRPYDWALSSARTMACCQIWEISLICMRAPTHISTYSRHGWPLVFPLNTSWIQAALRALLNILVALKFSGIRCKRAISRSIPAEQNGIVTNCTCLGAPLPSEWHDSSVDDNYWLLCIATCIRAYIKAKIC